MTMPDALLARGGGAGAARARLPRQPSLIEERVREIPEAGKLEVRERDARRAARPARAADPT